MMKQTSIAILLTAFGLAGCVDSTVTGEWSCPQDQPDGCHSVTTGDQLARKKISNGVNPGLAPIPLTATPDIAADGAMNDEAMPDDETPEAMSETHEQEPGTPAAAPEVRRIPEEVTKIRIGPFIDRDGNYHPPGMMHIILKPAEWRQVK